MARGRRISRGPSGEHDLNADNRSPGQQPDLNPLQLFDDPGRPIKGTITIQALQELLQTVMTKKQHMTVVNNRLNKNED